MVCQHWLDFFLISFR
uniref:Uncharacterized protein n=1 Tax=Arundo donax TaxID=35708 RepID=A0A0A9CGR0_ARUDO